MALPNHRDLKYSFFFLQRNLVIVFQFQVIEHSFTVTRNLNTSCFVGFDVFFLFAFFFFSVGTYLEHNVESGGPAGFGLHD